VDTGNASLSHEKFWERVMAGESTVIMPLTPTSSGFSGDFITVNAGQTRNGADDAFTGTNQPGSHNIAGDALDVDATATLNGGDDRITGIAGTISGDLGATGFSAGNDGTVNGGNDTISASDASVSPVMFISQIAGDVDTNATGTVNGGNDRIVTNNVASMGLLAGDVLNHLAGSVDGGNDTIIVQRTGNLFIPSSVTLVSGDVFQTGTGANTVGGNDAITLRNVNSSGVVGDIYVADGNVIGGDDTISASWTAPNYAGPPLGPPPVPNIGFVSGDAFQIGNGDSINGGNDRITLKNIGSSFIVGDVFNAVGTAVEGGNDTISATWNQSNIPVPGGFVLAGDAFGVSSGLLNGGDDRLYAANNGPSPGSIQIFGDTSTFSGAGNFVGGDDVITAVSKSNAAGAQLFGDASAVNTTGTFTGGDDTITGTNGNDSIFGDAASVTAATYIGGDDILNGKGGNDVIDGGKGKDMAVYSSLKQAVYVDLNGITGTDPTPANEVEAIGQGNDQLISIENILGSVLDDTVLGNSSNNEFRGNAGDDYLDGRTGNDTLFGGSGDDTLVGNIGRDQLTGSLGADTFVFAKLTDTTVSQATADVITDFEHLVDQIDLSAIDANGAGAGSPAFSFVGGAALTGAAQVGFFTSGGDTYIRGSTDADAAAEFVIKLDGIVALTAADFIL
jgi:Ca2+-binding RTX toxin-like protein